MANAIKFHATVSASRLVLTDLDMFEGKQVEVTVTLDESSPARPRKRRPLGLYRGQFVVPEDFDAPWPADFQRYFDGGW